MLQLDDLIKITFSSALLLMMPGPTNTLLLCSGLSQGIIKSFKLIIAEWVGYLLSISAWGVAVKILMEYSYYILFIVKLISAIYVAYLAIKIWRLSLQKNNQSITVVTIFLTTLLNPKSFVIATLIIPTTAFTNHHDYYFSMLSILFALFPISLLWTACGAIMPLWQTRPTLFNSTFLYRIASLVIFIFSISMLCSSIFTFASEN
ncbi:LysE family transporter [Xenorhabdus szentirmaii]|uniref:LysE family translocator n=1 Tax=Xenorhabdus szentirmaii TaxID=290112 RepID=UPI0032B7C6A3